jgi:hypothetical protein
VLKPPPLPPKPKKRKAAKKDATATLLEQVADTKDVRQRRYQAEFLNNEMRKLEARNRKLRKEHHRTRPPITPHSFGE